MEYVQNKYANPYKAHPIMIMDKDDLSFEISKANLWGKEKNLIRWEFIANYVKEKRGIGISSNDASNIDTYISQLKNSAVALPLISGYWGEKEYKLCVVFHSDPNSNQRLENERLLGLNTPNVYGDLNYDHYKNRLSFDTLRKFSMYHELGHCLDTHYLPEMVQAHDDGHGVHESESFAETMGLFILAREGIQDVAQKRIQLRNVYSHKMGEFFMNNPTLGFGNPTLKYGGIIYFLEPALLAGEKLLKENEKFILNGTINELMDATKEIVEEHSLSSQAFHWIYTHNTEHKPTAEEQIRDLESSFPELFTGVLDRVLHFAKTTVESFEAAFDSSRPAIAVQGQLKFFNIQDFCPSFLSGDKDQFFAVLQGYRDDLSQELGTAQEQRDRQVELMGIYETVATKCHN